MPNEYITHLKQRLGCWCTLAYRSFPMPRYYRRPVRAATGVD